DPHAVTGREAVFHLALEQRPQDEGLASVACWHITADEMVQCGDTSIVRSRADGPAEETFYPLSVHGAAGDPVTYRWTVNAAAPDTTIASQPRALTTSRRATISF